MKEKKPISPFLFYMLVCVFFFIDLAAFFLFEKPLIYSLLCFYILQLSRPMGIIRILTACLLLSFSPLIQYDRFGLELLYLIPATFLGNYMRQMLYDSYWQYYLLLAACLLTQMVVVEQWILHLGISITYTISTLFVNLMVIWLMRHSTMKRSTA